MADKQVDEMIVVRHILKELEALPTARARLRVFAYAMDRCREDIASGDTIPSPKQPELSGLNGTHEADPFGGLGG